MEHSSLDITVDEELHQQTDSRAGSFAHCLRENIPVEISHLN